MMRKNRKSQAIRQRPPIDWHALMAQVLLAVSPYRRALLIGLFGVALVGSVWLSLQLLLTDPGIWPIERVFICSLQVDHCQALQHADQAAVQQASRELVQDGMLLVFPAAIQQALQRVAWVKQVRVSRRWPAELRIDIEEYQAAARWWPDNTYCHAETPHCQLLDGDGVAFTVAQTDWDAALPCLSGPPDSAQQIFEQYQQLQPILAQQAQNIRCLRMSPHRNWDLTLADGTLLRLGKQALVARLQRFFKVYPILLRDSGDLQIAHFDLRYPNGVVVQWR